MIKSHISFIIIAVGLTALIVIINILMGVRNSPVEEFAENIIQNETGINVKPLVDCLEEEFETENNNKK